MSINLTEFEQHPDPDTPQFLLPLHLRAGNNSREELCRREALRLAFGYLSQKQRQALHMRYDLGMSFRKLSAELGISRSAAAKRVKRSQETLKTLVELCVLVEKEVGKKDDI